MLTQQMKLRLLITLLISIAFLCNAFTSKADQLDNLRSQFEFF